MATHTPAANREPRCPCCGRPYAYRVPARLDDVMNLSRHYRCGRSGTYLYLHEIKLRWDGLGIAA